MDATHDLLIVGSGLVGASLACALHGSGLRVALVEASPAVPHAAPSFDERNLALAHASCQALQALGVWKHLATRPSPIQHIHVSSRGDFGAVRLDAADHGVDAFGAVVVARELGAALEARLAELTGLQRLRPARVTALQVHPERIVASASTPQGEQHLSSRLLVVADGTESLLRRQLGIGTERHDYEQTLFVATVEPERKHGQVAYERFTDSGPVAMLPRADGVCGSICTVSSQQAATIAALDDAGYVAFLQDRFGWRLGRLRRIGKRSAYPLQRVCAQALTAPRAVLVGNAAQTIHPVGAQGFNLGLRDALTLAGEVIAAQRARTDVGAEGVLARYVQRRRPDREATMARSDGLVRLFANRFAPLRALRSMALTTLGLVPALGDDLVSGAMGLRHDAMRALREDVA